MKISKFKLASASAVIAFAMTGSPAQATSAPVVLNLEGNPTCSALSENSMVLEARDNSPASGDVVPMPISGGDDQMILYTISNDSPPAISWEILNADPVPVDYMIIKAKGRDAARVFHYGGITTGGANSDAGALSRGDEVQAISFCYGISDGTGQPPPEGGLDFTAIPRCEELPKTDGMVGDLFTTGVLCPTEPPPGEDVVEQQLIISMALNKLNMGFNFDEQVEENNMVRACTCNVTLPPCNPALPLQKVNELGEYLGGDGQPIMVNGMTITAESDGLSGEERACQEYGPILESGIPAGVNQVAPLTVEVVENPDSYVCYTYLGRRYCYGHY